MDSRPITIRLTLPQVLLIARALKSQGENELAERFESLHHRMACRSESEYGYEYDSDPNEKTVMEFFKRLFS